LDVTAAASGLDAKAAIDDENCEPFSSSWTRLLFGVAELKNVFQLVVISATALDEPPAAEGGTDGADCADDGADAGAPAEADDPGVEELEPPLEQADIAATSARPSAGAR
jgi:hypothetical protein